MATPKMEQIGKWGGHIKSRSEAGKKSTSGIVTKDEVRKEGKMIWASWSC